MDELHVCWKVEDMSAWHGIKGLNSIEPGCSMIKDIGSFLEEPLALISRHQYQGDGYSRDLYDHVFGAVLYEVGLHVRILVTIIIRALYDHTLK